eukprot:TRINITY_DN6429_c0_g1_i1.p5 TRINITY_DN6429_c0_g1~~TRINITY_DN6429_c0_g1_i1.p5  ORF type:complete len:106 (-),score=22.88 TRINITY_DN6429_c0_g1_i1:84-401(-)
MGEIDKYAAENVHKILVGNKCDMEDKRKVSFEEGELLAKQFKIKFLETSAKTATNVDDSFQKIARQIIDEKSIPGNSESKKDRKELQASIPLEQQNSQNQASSCC